MEILQDESWQEQFRRPCVVISDLDGTLQAKGDPIPQETLDFFRSPGAPKLTLATGRGFMRINEVLKTGIIAPNIPMILEGGARLVMPNGLVVEEILFWKMDILLFWLAASIQLSKIEFMAYFPKGNSLLYFFYKDQATLLKYIVFAEEATMYPKYFFEWLWERPPAQMVVKAKEGEQLIFPGLSCVCNEGYYNITTFGVDKALGIQCFLNHTNYSPYLVAFAGNDHNDLPVFREKSYSLMTKIFVGPEERWENLGDQKISYDHRAESPAELIQALRKAMGPA